MMRYQIYIGQDLATKPLHSSDNLLLDTNDPSVGAYVSASTLDLGLNKAGGVTVTLLRQNPFYNSVELMKTVMEVWRDNALYWKGRVIKISPNQDGSKTVDVEGNLNYLMDVPDTFTNNPDIAKHYKLGSEVTSETLAFAETGEGSGIFCHEWASGDGFEWLYTYERGAVFFVMWDGNKDELKNERGYLGDISIVDSTADRDAGASVDFFIDNDGIYTTSDATTHTVKIWRRDRLTIQQMFNQMFGVAGYNNYAHNGSLPINRLLYGGVCDVSGNMIYDPGIDTTCLDTLKAWQEIYGGYIYTSYDPSDPTEPKWRVNYTQSKGLDRSDVPVEYGVNITGIDITETAEPVVTSICGVGIDDETERQFYLPSTTTPGTEFAFDANARYLTLKSSYQKYGYVRQQRYYQISHASETKNTDLYNMVVRDLYAADQNTKSIRVSAFDARLVDKTAGSADVGDRCYVNAAPWGIDNVKMQLTDMHIDMIQPGRGVMQFGDAPKELTQQIKQ